MIDVAVRVELRAFALEVEATFPRGITVVAGPSGSGKTTLLRTIAGLTAPHAGRVALDGVLLDGGAARVPAFRRDIGCVFQEYALFPHLDVAANVAYGLAARGADSARRAEAVATWLDRLGLRGLAGARPGALSGGERQRVAVARALAWAPRAVLLDEPFAALDDATRADVRERVRATLAALGVPVVLVTHDEDDVAFFGAAVLRLERGRVIEGGLPGKENGAVHHDSVRTAP